MIPMTVANAAMMRPRTVQLFMSEEWENGDGADAHSARPVYEYRSASPDG